MEPLKDFDKSISTSMFTFLIGPDEEKIYVHRDIVAKQSDVLDKMMNGKMKESIDNVARLPHINPKTFANFVSFCYFGDYRTSSNGNADRFSMAREVLRISNHRRFRCHRCAKSTALDDYPSWFPFCGASCGERPPAGSKYCVNCATNISSREIFTCDTCTSMITSADVVEAGHEIARVVCERRISYERLLHDDDLLFDLYTEFLKRSFSWSPSDNLQAHLELCLFAEIYDSTILQGLCLTKLVNDLCRFTVTDATAGDITRLIVYGYENTYDNAYCIGEILRQMLAKFACGNLEVMLRNKDFVAAIDKVDDLSLYLLRTFAPEC